MFTKRLAAKNILFDTKLLRTAERKKKEAEKKAIEAAKNPDPKQVITNLFTEEVQERKNKKNRIKSMSDLLK